MTLQNANEVHTKFNFGTLIVVILYKLYTLHFVVYRNVASYILYDRAPATLFNYKEPQFSCE